MIHRLRTVLILLAVVTTAQAQSDIFVLTSDFATGSTALLLAGATTAQTNLLGIHSDAVGVYQDGRIYVINRLGQDNILVLDPADPTTPVTQFSVGNGSNPRDIEVVSPDKAYVTRYASNELLIVDPQDGSELGTVDLSNFADADGLPEMDQIVRIGDRLYVSLQRLDRDAGFVPGDAFLVVVDINTDSLVGDISLSVSNPNSMFVVGQRIVVAGAAGFGDRAGGIDLVDPATESSLGLIVTEEQLGGDLSVLALRTSNDGFAVLLDESFVNSVVPVNLETGVVGAPLEGLSGGFIASIAVDGDRLLVGDQGSFDNPTSAGLKIFDSVTGALVAGPVDTGLPPNSIVVLNDDPITAVLAAATDAVPEEAALGRGYPNPFNATVVVPFAVSVGGRAQVQVFDALGQHVRDLVSRTLTAGHYTVTWDGTDASGSALANGAYFVRLRTATSQQAVKVMLLK